MFLRIAYAVGGSACSGGSGAGSKGKSGKKVATPNVGTPSGKKSKAPQLIKKKKATGNV